jgi:hypothetical protein
MSHAARLSVPGAFAIAMGALCAVLGTRPAAAEMFDGGMIRPNGEFEIGNGDVKYIADRRKPTTIRVCVNEAKHTVPLKVTSDRQDQLIAPGNCSDITGSRISLSAGARLEPEFVLVGKWTRMHV